jgi:hypothetical protein
MQTTSFKRSRRLGLAHFQRFADQAIAPRDGKYLSEGHRRAVTAQAAWKLAIAASKANAYANPLNVARDMGEMIKAAPRCMPATLDRLDLERIALDALHLARAKKGGAA